MDIQSLLENSSFFKGVSTPSREAIGRICRLQSLKKREILFLEGDEGRALYLLAEGTIQLYKTSAEGREVTIKFVKPGELFAEVILFESAVYPVSAVAADRSLVCALPRHEFHSLLTEESFRTDFIGMLMRKQRYLVGQILTLSGSDVETRFFKFLASQFGKREQYHITLSKKDVAAAIGANPETFSRLLLKLKEEGSIFWEGDQLRLRKGTWAERD
jgi:CRP-like cAMP-binding protein